MLLVHKRACGVVTHKHPPHPRVLVLRGLISYAGSSGSGQRGPRCRVTRQRPRGQALCPSAPGGQPPASCTCFSSEELQWLPYAKPVGKQMLFFHL